MATPNVYKKISSNSFPYRWHFLGLTSIGVIICVISILISAKSQINLLPLFGVGILSVLWGWGLFLIIHWYGKQSRLALDSPKSIIIIGKWASSVFLDAWFIIGTIGSLLFILHAY